MEEGLNMYCEDQWEPWGGQLQFDIMKDFLTIKAVLNGVRAVKDSPPFHEVQAKVKFHQAAWFIGQQQPIPLTLGSGIKWYRFWSQTAQIRTPAPNVTSLTSLDKLFSLCKTPFCVCVCVVS